MAGVRIIALSALIPATLALSGCETFRSARMYGECNNKIGGGGECKVGFEVKWEKGGGGTPQSLLRMALSSSDTLPDAAQYSLDVSGSTVPYPSSGWMTVYLKDSAKGYVVASADFAWSRSGNLIRAKDPDAINAWAYANAGTADTVAYELHKFTSSYGPGMQTIAGASSYEGVRITSYQTNFYGGPDCTRYPSPHLCRD